MTTQNKQLDAWTGEFGDDYTDRNRPTDKNINERIQFWAGIFNSLPVTKGDNINKILEIGSNVGANLVAIDSLYKIHNKNIELLALEPNKKARKELIQQDIRHLKVVDGTASEIKRDSNSVDITITCGVLIHLPQAEFHKAMGEIYRVTNRFIILAEYFSPEPRSIPYRGETDLLFARDFGGEFIDGFPGLRCAGYGFAWKRFTGMDNLTWWILEKVN